MAPPQERSKVYVSFLPNGDRITTRMVRQGSRIITFAVVHESVIDGKWRKITSFDNSHDSQPHQHHYHVVNDEFTVVMPWLNPNQALTEARKFITLNYEKLLANYL